MFLTRYPCSMKLLCSNSLFLRKTKQKCFESESNRSILTQREMCVGINGRYARKACVKFNQSILKGKCAPELRRKMCVGSPLRPRLPLQSYTTRIRASGGRTCTWSASTRARCPPATRGLASIQRRRATLHPTSYTLHHHLKPTPYLGRRASEAPCDRASRCARCIVVCSLTFGVWGLGFGV